MAELRLRSLRLHLWRYAVLLMSDTVVAALISAAVGLLVGLVPFVYRVRRDREESRERDEAERERTRVEAEREIERQRERKAAVAQAYLALLGKVMALLDVLRTDAVNADDLLERVSEANAELQGFAQGDLLVAFGAQSPVVWADRACRRILREAVDLAHNARHNRQDPVTTQYEIRQLTANQIDYGGPLELVRWATDTAVARWPKELTRFEGDFALVANDVSERAGLEPFAERTS